MKKSIHFIPSSLVCSVAIDLTVEDGVIREVCFEGGCSGNLQGISMLVRGMKVEEVIERLEGIQCGSKRTSCPDQLVKATQYQVEYLLLIGIRGIYVLRRKN